MIIIIIALLIFLLLLLVVVVITIVPSFPSSLSFVVLRLIIPFGGVVYVGERMYENVCVKKVDERVC